MRPRASTRIRPRPELATPTFVPAARRARRRRGDAQPERERERGGDGADRENQALHFVLLPDAFRHRVAIAAVDPRRTPASRGYSRRPFGEGIDPSASYGVSRRGSTLGRLLQIGRGSSGGGPIRAAEDPARLAVSAGSSFRDPGPRLTDDLIYERLLAKDVFQEEPPRPARDHRPARDAGAGSSRAPRPARRAQRRASHRDAVCGARRREPAVVQLSPQDAREARLRRAR